MDATILLTVNGKQRKVTTDPQRPLLDVLREEFQLTGAKFGCGEGRCGACTVLVNGQAVHSCLTPIANVQGKSVVTIEGLATGEKLHPVQEAFLAEEASQCGYCTPGMVLATVGLLARTPQPTDEQIVAALDGHLCRCCGYTNILKAVRRAAQPAGRG
ncbi:MAG: Nicotinate dehydrogenase subunit A [Phycisphaerae bacterium]|nr:Nicotinate dehydrogenase subunit A [Phycisphaerae bacterium]